MDIQYYSDAKWFTLSLHFLNIKIRYNINRLQYIINQFNHGKNIQRYLKYKHIVA